MRADMESLLALATIVDPGTDDAFRRSPKKRKRHGNILCNCANCAIGFKKNSMSILPQLSMGMTQDFAVAVEEGATLVRVGTAIFGERRRAKRE